MLEKQISSYKDRAEAIKIFTGRELLIAIDEYQRQILGSSDFGILDDRAVVVLDPQGPSELLRETAINMVIILWRINHKNVIKLLGRCLDTPVPLLVQEFVPNGSLCDYIHSDATTRISWDIRLRIAIEIADALTYLHIAGSVPIFHRNLKSSSILLDHHHTVKVSGFAVARFALLDQRPLEAGRVGTAACFDPEASSTH